MEPRNTVKDLEEFRRRKATERELASKATKMQEPIKSQVVGKATTIDSRCPVHGSESSLAQTEDVQIRKPSIHVGPSSILQRFSTWIYEAVMPEPVVPGSDNAGLPSESTDLTEDPEDDNQLLDEGAKGSLHAVENLGTFEKCIRWLRRLLRSFYIWCLLAWMCGFALAVRYGWGAVFFCLSVLFVIWKGLSDKRKRGTLSAYSVFNPNLERIEGTLDAEQLQRQMFFRF